MRKTTALGRLTFKRQWDRSALRTIQRLFGLHLTVRYQTEDIERALDWLIEKASEAFVSRRLAMAEPVTVAALRGRFLNATQKNEALKACEKSTCRVHY